MRGWDPREQARGRRFLEAIPPPDARWPGRRARRQCRGSDADFHPSSQPHAVLLWVWIPAGI